MNFERLIDEIQKSGRDFYFHKIFFTEKINEALALGFIFDNPKVSELIAKTKETPSIKNKLDLCVELIRNVSLKRITLSNEYFEDIKTAIQCALLIYFDFIDYSPLRGIISIKQEEIGKGNFLVLKIDYDRLKEPIIALLAILLTEKLREIINASPYSSSDRKYIENLLSRKFPTLSPPVRFLILDFSKYIMDKVFIKLIDVNRSDLSILDVFLDSLIYYYDETFKILDLVDQDRFLRNIISRRTTLLKKLVIEKYGNNAALLLSKSSNTQTNIEFTPNINNYRNIDKVIEVESLRIKVLAFNKIDESEVVEKLGVILKEETKDEKRQIQLPYDFKDKFSDETELELYSFVCENCLSIGYSDYCEICKRSKRLSFYCDKCGISNQGSICIACGQKLEPLKKIKINISNEIAKKLYELQLGPEYIHQIDFINTKYIEPLEKMAIKVKNRINVSEHGISEVSVKALPADEFNFGDRKIKLANNEIIIPYSVRENFHNILSYLENLLTLYDLNKSEIKINGLEEGETILIRNSRNFIYYPVKIKKIVSINYALIPTKLHEKLFGNIISDNNIKMCLPLDFLLNASSRLLDGEKGACFLIMPSEENEKKEASIENILFEKEIEDPPKAIAFNFKMNFMRNLTKLIETNIGLQIRCPKCEQLMTRPRIRLFCTKCGNRLTYKWIKKEVNDAIKEYNEYLKMNALIPIFKLNNRKIKKVAYRFFKEEEKLEKLDKFFNL